MESDDVYGEQSSALKHKCFVCGSNHFCPEFSGRMVYHHKYFRCADCGTVIAQTEGAAEMDYSDYGDYLVEEISWGKILEKTKKTHSKLLTKMKGKQKSILDFGAGAGFFVKAAKDNGFEAVGCEPSTKLRDFASRTLEVTLFKDIQMMDGTFDAVCMFDVIEHIPDHAQRDVVALLLSKLNPGGLLIGNTPNIDSANMLIRKENDPSIWPPSHCSHFSPFSIRVYLESFGLQKVVLYTNGFRLFRANKERLSFLEKNTSSALLKWLCIFPIKAAFRFISMVLSRFGYGYQIHFIYRKPE